MAWWGFRVDLRNALKSADLATLPLGSCVSVHHPSCVHPGPDGIHPASQWFLLHCRPPSRYIILNSKHLKQFVYKPTPDKKGEIGRLFVWQGLFSRRSTIVRNSLFPNCGKKPKFTSPVSADPSCVGTT